MATKIVTPEEVEQLDYIFGEIDSCAAAIERFAVMLAGEQEDQRDVEQLTAAIERLAQTTQWAASLGCQKVGGVMVGRPDAERLMMPPAYHQAAERASNTRR